MRVVRPVVLLAVLAMSSACSTVAGEPVSAAPPPVQTMLPSSTPSPSAHPLVMPNIVGMFWTDAEPRLRRLGWTGVLVKGADIAQPGIAANCVAAQDPAAGAVLGSGDPITLSFAR